MSEEEQIIVRILSASNSRLLWYEHYYGIKKDSDPVRYPGFRPIFLDTCLCTFLGLAEDCSPKGRDYRAGAEVYLRSGGMTEEQIAGLKRILS